MDLKENLISTENKFSGRVIRLDIDTVELPNGKSATREIAYISNAVGVLALDDEERALIVEQYRAPYRQILMEIPAGKVDEGEAPEQAAVRELMEETGYKPLELSYLGPMYPTPGCVFEIIHLFVAKNLVPANAEMDEDEFINSSFVPISVLAEKIQKGELPDAKTQASVMRYLYSKIK